MSGLNPLYPPLAFQPHVILLVTYLGALWNHCISLEVYLFKPKAVIRLQKKLFIQGGEGGPWLLTWPRPQERTMWCSLLRIRKSVYLQGRRKALKNYTQEESTKEEADYPPAASFPKCSAHSQELQVCQAIVSLTAEVMGRTPGWSRTFQS